MRTFIAINLTEEIKQGLSTVWEQNSIKHQYIKWVKPENLHLTLKFLGDINIYQLNEVKLILKNICKRHKQFPLEIKNLGSFPNFQKPRIIWAGISRNASLDKLIDDISLTIGNSSNNKEYRPHITLARIKENYSVENQLLILEKYRESYFGKMNVDGVYIMESNLRPDGPIYKKIFLSKLSS